MNLFGYISAGISIIMEILKCVVGGQITSAEIEQIVADALSAFGISVINLSNNVVAPSPSAITSTDLATKSAQLASVITSASTTVPSVKTPEPLLTTVPIGSIVTEKNGSKITLKSGVSTVPAGSSILTTNGVNIIVSSAQSVQAK